MYENVKKVLSIAGSDSSGGAGIQADIKTISAHKHYAMTAIAALTAQNTQGVAMSDVTSTAMLYEQIKSVFEDIVPDAVKTGMLSSAENVDITVSALKEFKAKNIVIDPVMVATSGAKLMSDDAINIYIEKLFPIADIITPNLQEAQVLSGITIATATDIYESAKRIREMTSASILIKGGHFDYNDYLFIGDDCHVIKGEYIDNKNTHGTGCTLSSAIACRLAEGKDIITATTLAKEYVAKALKTGFNIGTGSGPLLHIDA